MQLRKNPLISNYLLIHKDKCILIHKFTNIVLTIPFSTYFFVNFNLLHYFIKFNVIVKSNSGRVNSSNTIFIDLYRN